MLSFCENYMGTSAFNISWLKRFIRHKKWWLFLDRILRQILQMFAIGAYDCDWVNQIKILATVNKYSRIYCVVQLIIKINYFSTKC